jgi:uncharacterized membrane protein YraQ (UPF0718 family)
MSKESSKRALFRQGTTSKWVVIGVLIAGLIRIALAIIKGTDIAEAIGTTIVGVILALLAYMLFNERFRHNGER